MPGSLWKRFAVSLGCIGSYGCTDVSGDSSITIDSDKCDGCVKCVDACPQSILEIVTDDYDELVANFGILKRCLNGRA